MAGQKTKTGNPKIKVGETSEYIKRRREERKKKQQESNEKRAKERAKKGLPPESNPQKDPNAPYDSID